MASDLIPLTKVNICGIPHKIKICEDNFDVDCHFAMIDYKTAEIRINKYLSDPVAAEAICHEWYTAF